MVAARCKGRSDVCREKRCFATCWFWHSTTPDCVHANCQMRLLQAGMASGQQCAAPMNRRLETAVKSAVLLAVCGFPRCVQKIRLQRQEAQASFHSVLSIHNTATILGESKCVKRGPFRLRLVCSFEPMSSTSQDAPALIDEQPSGSGCSGHRLLEHRHRHIGTGTQHSHARQPTCGGHASGGTAARPQPQPSRRCCLKRAALSALQQVKKAEPGRRHSALLACDSTKNNNPGQHPPDL